MATMSEASAPDPGERRVRSRGFDRLATSAEGVYGLILVAGMIVVSRNLTGGSVEAFLTVVVTLVVFFVAHVYAATVSGLADPRTAGLREAVRHGVRESMGLLVVGAVPIAVLVLGVTGILRQGDAVWAALIVDGIMLGVLGWVIASAREATLWGRTCGALLTAACGALMILLKVLIHH